jgi:hypothetical protein
MPRHAPPKVMKRRKPEPMSKQTAVIKELTERFNGLPEVWFQNELLEQTRDYLTRGQRFKTLKIDLLNEEWAKAFRQFVEWRIGPHIRDLDDTGAELRLRGKEFPTHLVRLEVEQLQLIVQRIDSLPLTAEFSRKIDEFITDMNRPKN